VNVSLRQRVEEEATTLLNDVLVGSLSWEQLEERLHDRDRTLEYWSDLVPPALRRIANLPTEAMRHHFVQVAVTEATGFALDIHPELSESSSGDRVTGVQLRAIASLATLFAVLRILERG